MRIREQAICIRHIDWSETSQVVALLTQGHGKVRGVAKGSKRLSPGSVARFSGGIELLTRGEVVAIAKPTTDLANITEWDLQAPFRHLRQSLSAQRLALYGCDIAGALLADHDPHPRAFTALDRLLNDLADEARAQAALLRFQWTLIADTGYQPELNKDVVAGGGLADRAAYIFDARAGGVTAAQKQSSDHAGTWRVRRETVALLRQIAAEPDTTVEETIAEEPARRANRLLCVYIRALLDRELPTMRLLLSDKPNR